MLLGAWAGKWILRRMDQRVFENLALALVHPRRGEDVLLSATTMGRSTSRQLWTAKLQGEPVPARARGSRAGAAAELLPRRAFVGIVLGIDPSLRGTGLALIDFHPGRAPVLLRCTTVRVPAKRPMAVALGEIHRAVSLFIEGTKGIRHVALEQTIYVQNFQTAQILGAARGRRLRRRRSGTCRSSSTRRCG